MKTRPAIVLAGVLFGWISRQRYEQAKAALDTATAPTTGPKTTKVPPDQSVGQRSAMAASVVKNHRTGAPHGALDHAIE
ncbi:hypothetical protein N8E89_00650 [Phyllobacterium sp. A18/5-2]|uniref:hypothetical protein n=1 Tax=Phyllobacterium sp. A18/5-2 TaxID=2978392 RepID=UPI0021C651CD|nr:hypothetical protein [Phyllobacterium sp. A18/5-2]UXN64432.1 hypothetical protein N8E89_00650 [Phyllobacterium sp. A18/5-2]